MTQIERLRNRLRNVGKSTTEYRMTVSEAVDLLNEIDELNATLLRKIEEKSQQVVTDEPIQITRTIDGGNLKGS